MGENRKIVVTSALPYANGDIHIGHLVEYVQTDFWVRFQKMRGNECVYVCADDFEISGNTINSAADVNYANGINIDGPSSNGDVYDNVITVDAPLAAYGTYSYQYMGQIDAINYANNTITASAYAAIGMETVECNPAIVDNTIVANGKENADATVTVSVIIVVI